MITAIINNTNNTNKVLELLGLNIEKRILFVSSQAIINRSFNRTINKSINGNDIHFFLSSKEAISSIESNRYSVIIATETIDEIDGIEFLEISKKISPKSNRLFISGNSDIDNTIRAINKAALFNFIVLPWEPNELRQIVAQAVDNFTLKHENANLSMLLENQAQKLTTLADQLEITVETRTASLLIGLNAALDLRDTETHGHSKRVALYAKKLAMEMDVSPFELIDIERGAMLHDIGKIGVSDSILLKPGKLTPEEWIEMKKHPEMGYKILENIPFLFNASYIVRQHHERFDGKGYPHGIKGKDIVLGARIFAIIDTYDAMTSDRPYRKSLSHEKAMEEINKCSNSQFDPKLVEKWNQIKKYELLALRLTAEKNLADGVTY